MHHKDRIAHSAMRETARANRYTNAQRAMMQAAIARLDKLRSAKETRERIAAIATVAIIAAIPFAIFYVATN